MVCCWRRVSLCRMQLPEARFGPSVRRGLGAERPSWLRGLGWGLGAEGFRAPNPASPRRITLGEWVSGTGDPQQSSRAQGAGAAQPRFALWSWGGWDPKGLRCFLDPRRVGAVVCCPRRVSLYRLQLPEARFGPSVRRGLGDERPSWLRGHGWGLGAEGLRAPRPQPCLLRLYGRSAPRPRRTEGPKRASGSCILQRETLLGQQTTAPTRLGSRKQRKPFSSPAPRSP